jgi:hypothetical protein
MKKRGEPLTVANGGSVVQEPEGEPKVSGTLNSAFEAWIQDFIDGGAHADTIAAKRLVAKEFQESGKVKALAAVTRQMCQKYINEWLKKQGNDDRTRFNTFLHLRQFLKFNGVNSLLTTKDSPPYDLKDPVALEDEDLALFWRVCPGHKKLLHRGVSRRQCLHCSKLAEQGQSRGLDVFCGGRARLFSMDIAAMVNSAQTSGNHGTTNVIALKAAIQSLACQGA